MAGSISTHKHSGDQPRERLASAALGSVQRRSTATRNQDPGAPIYIVYAPGPYRYRIEALASLVKNVKAQGPRFARGKCQGARR
jgi:hypothetical protein